ATPARASSPRWSALPPTDSRETSGEVSGTTKRCMRKRLSVDARRGPRNAPGTVLDAAHDLVDLVPRCLPGRARRLSEAGHAEQEGEEGGELDSSPVTESLRHLAV